MKNRSYGRMELAMLYCPDVVPQAAWRKLRSWIAYNKQLSAELSALGYDEHRRTFTPAEVAAICRYLGDPE